MKAQEVLRLEKELTFNSFDNEDAYNIAQIIINRVKKEKLKNLRIRVVLNQEIVFQYLMNGKKGTMWLERKQKTIETLKHCGYYLALENQEHGTYQQYENDETMILCGGSFPITVQEQIIGCFIVSGLRDDEDHQLIVDAFKAYLGDSK